MTKATSIGVAIVLILGIGIGIYVGTRLEPTKDTKSGISDGSGNASVSRAEVPNMEHFSAFAKKFAPAVHQHLMSTDTRTPDANSRVEFKLVRTDLKATDSLANPIVGEAVCQLTTSRESDTYSSTIAYSWVLTFGFKSEKWHIIKGTSRITDIIEFPRLERERSRQVGAESDIAVQSYLAGICNRVQQPRR